MATMKSIATDDVETVEWQEAEQTPALRVHIVKKGDTLRTIAREYLGDSRKVEKIRQINDLGTDNLKVGRELIIPER